MYSRSYFTDTEDKMKLPTNYDGTAFSEPKSEEKLDTGSTYAENPTAKPTSSGSVSTGGDAREGGLLSGLQRSLFGGFFDTGRLSLKLPKLGVEEILILATAAFLFFSAEGDRECAVLLLLLLLIN